MLVSTGKLVLLEHHKYFLGLYKNSVTYNLDFFLLYLPDGSPTLGYLQYIKIVFLLFVSQSFIYLFIYLFYCLYIYIFFHFYMWFLLLGILPCLLFPLTTAMSVSFFFASSTFSSVFSILFLN